MIPLIAAGIFSPACAEDELHDDQRDDSGEHDGSAGFGVRGIDGEVGGAVCGIRHGLSDDDVVADSLRHVDYR